MLYQCTDGDVSCGEYFNCMDLIARKKLPCGSKSPECLKNARDGNVEWANEYEESLGDE